MSGNCEQIRIRRNYTLIEASEPSSNFVYFARSLTYGKSFCVSVGKLVDEVSSDFSFVVGFTTCSPGSILNENFRHLNEQCTPTGCGGHSQQVKIFNASVIGAKVTFERQANGEIYFAIDSAMPIRIQFDKNSCVKSLVRHEQLTPYIQLSGNVATLKTETNNFRKLNIVSALAVRRGQPLGTATAFGPRQHVSRILPTTLPGQAHQAFVASSDFDTKFVELIYPENDVKLSVNRMAVLRKNENGERFVYYLNKELKLNTEVTFQVTKIYNADKYTNGFGFGITTASANLIKICETEFVVDPKISPYSSHTVEIDRDIKLNDKFTFKRSGLGSIEMIKNGVIQRVATINRKFQQSEHLLPFVKLNGTVSGIIISNATSDAVNMEFDQIYVFPPAEFKTTQNITITNQNLLSWSTQSGKDGVIVNAKPFDKVLKFIIRDVRVSNNSHSLTFGLINSANVGFSTPREISSRLDEQHDNLIQSPALGLKFSLYKTPYGKVTLKYDDCDSDPIKLFMVDPAQRYYPVVILNGSVVAIELLPNANKKIVKYMPTKSTSQPQPQLPPPSPTNDCKICMDHPINSVFVPCGHRFACYDCAKEWMNNGNTQYNSNLNCPVCRKKISNLVQTFD